MGYNKCAFTNTILRDCPFVLYFAFFLFFFFCLALPYSHFNVQTAAQGRHMRTRVQNGVGTLFLYNMSAIIPGL